MTTFLLALVQSNIHAQKCVLQNVSLLLGFFYIQTQTRSIVYFLSQNLTHPFTSSLAKDAPPGYFASSCFSFLLLNSHNCYCNTQLLRATSQLFQLCHHRNTTFLPFSHITTYARFTLFQANVCYVNMILWGR